MTRRVLSEDELFRIHAENFASDPAYSDFTVWINCIQSSLGQISIAVSVLKAEPFLDYSPLPSLGGGDESLSSTPASNGTTTFYVFHLQSNSDVKLVSTFGGLSTEQMHFVLRSFKAIKQAGGRISHSELFEKIGKEHGSGSSFETLLQRALADHLIDCCTENTREKMQMYTFGIVALVELSEKLSEGFDYDGTEIRLSECLICKSLIVLRVNEKKCINATTLDGDDENESACPNVAHEHCIRRIQQRLQSIQVGPWKCPQCRTESSSSK